MGIPFIHSVIVEEQDPAADAILTHDLPVNPLSGLLLEIKPLNDTGSLTDYQATAGLLDALNSIRVLWQGQTILDITGRDLWAALLHRWNITVNQSNQVNTDDDRRSLILPIMFGRRWGDPLEGIPKTRSGELVLRLDVDVASTGYNDLRYQIEALELPDARFTHFTRLTTISQTFAATGNNDVVLPTEWDKRGILLFNTTAFAGATPTPGLGRVSILVNGVERGYTSTDIERLRGLYGALGKIHPRYDEHLHVLEGTGAAGDNTSEPEQIDAPIAQYSYLDFDLTRDDTYNLATRGEQRLVLRSDADVAEAMRILPIEKVPINEFFRT